ncbi:uncharacterized protein LOC128293798 [Gossypium arboreum]|uniref:uncharacterized protein LOC128293798 n=1 Tax=Gossypium arboreum TaxID=29729 RepID=UPI0022F19908|nr:uncharacterized protein LOC128293798 [Gossypium arboreum]
MITPQSERDFAMLIEKAKIAEDVKRAERQNLEKDKGRNKRVWEPSSSAIGPKKKARFNGPVKVGPPIATFGSQPSDLMELSFEEFDIILGMDWLVKHQANLDCATKLLRTKKGDEVIVIGERRNYLSNVISALRAEKLVLKGCEEYLTYVSASSSEISSVKDIRIVKDFSNVFHDELPELPPNYEVEFGIEIFPGTAPMSIALYKMAPKELEELKAQIQELLDRGFIRPSVSLWRAPVLLVKKQDETMRIAEEEHDAHLHVVLQILREKQLYVKFKKFDALSRWTVTDLRAMFARLNLLDDGSLLAKLQVKPRWIEQIKGKQLEDESLGSHFRQIENGKTLDFGLNSEGVLYFYGRAVHQKMLILGSLYYKKHIVVLVLCILVKVDHQFPSGLLQPVEIPLWKWERLPLELDQIHDVFHVSMLRRYHSDLTHIVSIEEIEVRPDLAFEKKMVQIFDRDVKVLRRNSVPLVKVLWRNHTFEEATWEPEEAMRQ